jgi:hypothetical protein
VSVSDAVHEAAARLEAAGLRVALRSGDLTPPCVYLLIGAVSDAGVPFAGGTATTLWAYYVPVRTGDDVIRDADALDALLFALSPLALTELVASKTSLTVSNDTWPAYRADVALLSQPVTVPASAEEA